MNARGRLRVRDHRGQPEPGAAHSCPGNYGQTVPETRTFAQLAPGDYGVTAASVTAGATTYVPVPATQTVTLSSGEEEAVGVGCAP